MRTDIDYRLQSNRRLGFDYFYKFHLETNDCSPDIAVEKWMADQLNFDYEKRCVIALFHGATYAGPCESMFANLFPVFTPEVVPDMIKFFNNNKKRLLFSPDCKYRKMVFPKFLESVGKSIEHDCVETLGQYIKNCFVYSELQNYVILREKCMYDWYHWGRMGHWCFAEALHRFIDAPILPPTMEFGPTGKSHTSGWAFCIGRDDLLDRIERLNDAEIKHLEESASSYLDNFNTNNPQINPKLVTFFTLETACCNYKRQHKGSRYGGCYIDEQYSETMQMQRDWPEFKWLWDKYLEGRQVIFPDSVLYENHKNEEGNDAKDSYLTDWNNALKDYGRIPRVEAYINKTPQRWTELSNMPFAKTGSDLTLLFG